MRSLQHDLTLLTKNCSDETPEMFTRFLDQHWIDIADDAAMLSLLNKICPAQCQPDLDLLRNMCNLSEQQPYKLPAG